jgi:carboxylesterase type B
LWETAAGIFVSDILLSIPFNPSSSIPTPTATPKPDPRISEDCLFLDVFVQRQVFESAGLGYGAPVLVWIYGGGYTSGEKALYNPAGLLTASGNASNGEIIYVAMNYRLGAFGWLSGPSFQAQGGAANAGLLDQRFSLEWVQQYIGLFGGDKNRVTIMGQSAGGGSVMHQITVCFFQFGVQPQVKIHNSTLYPGVRGKPRPSTIPASNFSVTRIPTFGFKLRTGENLQPSLTTQ